MTNSTSNSNNWYSSIINEVSGDDPKRDVDTSKNSPAQRLEESSNPSINAESAINNKSYKNRKVNNAFLGEMLSFKYDPKHKDKLPYYDAVPLIILMAKYKDGFLGLNLHYMPKKGRKKLIEEVRKGKRAKKKAMGMMATLTRNPRHGFLWKRYLFTQVKSRVINIPVAEWDYIVDLPVQFEKASHKKIYSDYKRY